MQRPGYGHAPPPQSPPLHHPVPQHVSTVPQLRSPPPPASQQQAQNGYGYGQQQQQQGSYVNPAFGGFMNDSTAQMGIQVGKSAVMAGQEYMEQNFNRYVNVSALKHYFNVTNSYVVNKLILVLFPWRHKPWSRKQAMSQNGQESYFLPPRDDLNSPDMYIPVMALVTYILLSTLLAGLRGAFHPELLGLTATTAFAVVIFEILGLKLGCYSGYKFVGIIVTIVIAEIANRGAGTGGWIGWTVFIYTFLALAFFLLRSLKYVLLPDNSSDPSRGAMQTVGRSQRNRRTQFLFLYSYIVQLIFMWVLSRQEVSTKAI